VLEIIKAVRDALGFPNWLLIAILAIILGGLQSQVMRREGRDIVVLVG
jgi:hypothetical protein